MEHAPVQQPADGAEDHRRGRCHAAAHRRDGETTSPWAYPRRYERICTPTLKIAKIGLNN